jgi:hypothetical protein
MLTATETKEMNAWISSKWMGKSVIQARGSADCIGRKGTVEETMWDEKGALHCRMSGDWWCPAASLEII